jgi:hypothetical protein
VNTNTKIVFSYPTELQESFCSSIIHFTFIPLYGFKHHKIHHTLTLLDPCFKTGYLTCESDIRACGPWWLKPLCETHDQGTISCPPTRAPKETPAPHLKSALFLVEAVQFETGLYQNEASFHHSQPFSSRPPPPYLTTRSKPRAAKLTSAKLFPRYNFRYF